MRSLPLRHAAASGLVALAFAACASAVAPVSDVRIRIRNASPVDFDGVRVDFPSGREDYGPVSAGGQTAYRTVDEAYRYARVEAAAGGDTLLFQPFDYVGERLLDPGRYTYELDVASGEPHLRLELMKD